MRDHEEEVGLRSPGKGMGRRGERIRYSEVELKEATPEALRGFIVKWNIFERECDVWWDRSLIHEDVMGFLDLRWKEFVTLQHKFPGRIVESWLDVFTEKFEEFIL